MKAINRSVAIATTALALTLAAHGAHAGIVVWEQDFETDTGGWLDETGGWAGTATRVASGSGGITSAGGGFHAEFTQTSTPAAGGVTGPFSRFDGYRDTWPGGMTATIDVYLDLAWSAGEGFDYSVAANETDGTHLQDFIFHVTKDTSTGQLLVGGSNNTNFDPREDLETINNFAVGSSGWYTFQHVFRDAGGVLEVDLNLLDDGGTVLFTETRTTPGNVIPSVVGGNRYAWFTNIDVADGIAVDNHRLTLVPEPATLAMMAAPLALLGLRRRAAR